MGKIIGFNEAKKKNQDKEAISSEDKRCNYIFQNLESNFLKNLKNERRKFNTASISNIAEKILKTLNLLYSEGSTPIVKIAEIFGIKSFHERIEENNIGGYLYIDGTTAEVYEGYDRVITVNETESFYFRRFVVARQLGVFLLNFREKIEYKEKRRLFKDEYLKEEHCTDYERFATEILMPFELFGKQYCRASEDMGMSVDRKCYITKYLSEYFRVPEYLVERRIEEIIN